MSSFVSWAGKVLDSVDEGAATALQKALKNDYRRSSNSSNSPDQERASPADNNGPPPDNDSSNASAAVESVPAGSKDEQIASLTKVWHETRDELARVRARLRSRDDVHRQSLQKLRDQMDARVSDSMESSTERISMLEGRLAEVSETRDLLQAQVEALKAQVVEVSATNSKLLQEKDDLQSELDQSIVDRSMQIQALQDEFAVKENELRENALAASGSLEQFRDLESKLLNDKEQYVMALAQADRDLQKMSASLRAAQEEKHNVQAELNGVQAKLAECQMQLQRASSNEHQARQSAVSFDERLSAALKSQSDSFEMERIQMQNRIAELSAQLRSSNVDAGLAARADALQRKVEVLTKTLLQRQSEIERIGSVSSTLGLQLDNERARCIKLEEERRALEQRLSDVINSPDYDHDFRRRRLRPYQHRLVSKVVDVFDGIGTSLTRVMRRSARTRVAMVIYIVVLHLWVLYILSILARTPAAASDRISPAL